MAQQNPDHGNAPDGEHDGRAHEHSPHKHGQRDHRHEDRPNLRALVGNLTGAGQPWPKVVVAVASNSLRKILSMRGCCGNHGQPGC